MSRITHPQPQVGVIIDRLGGIEFTDGVAEVDLTDKPNLREAYLQHGYTIEDLRTDLRRGDVFEMWAGDDTPELAPLPLPDAVEGETTPRVYEEFTLPKTRRNRKA